MNLLTASEPQLPDSVTATAGPSAIRLENVSVEYRAPGERIGSFKEYAIRLLQGRVRHEHFHALREVSLDIQPGEVFGVIGHNGAGKSTLLKVVSRVLRPTRGRVLVRGRLAPLLELGAGFHPELSGRENVFLNGTLLGFSHAQVEALFDGIVEFAELDEFIDAPLRTYSTGMAVRLGFAVATAVRPDILLVDEVLAVGDERFQEKCAARMGEFRQSGTTILLVTHDRRLVLSMCDRAVWLDHGQVAKLGPADEVVAAYQIAPRAKRATPVSPATQPTAADTPRTTPTDTLAELEEMALQQHWLYQFELPSGRQTPCVLPPDVAPINDTRWELLQTALAPVVTSGGWEQVSCLDLGCGQGYFSVKLAQQGCRPVLGVDARRNQINDADLMRRIYNLPKLQFRQLDLHAINPRTFGQYDAVLLLGLLFQLENPLGALRLARALARRVVVVETQLAPDLAGEMNWGTDRDFKTLQGSFAVLDRADDIALRHSSLTSISLCPGRAALLWIMEQLEFQRVEVIPPPPGAYEQFTTGKRMMVAGYL